MNYLYINYDIFSDNENVEGLIDDNPIEEEESDDDDDNNDGEDRKRKHSDSEDEDDDLDDDDLELIEENTGKKIRVSSYSLFISF